MAITITREWDFTPEPTEVIPTDTPDVSQEATEPVLEASGTPEPVETITLIPTEAVSLPAEQTPESTSTAVPDSVTPTETATHVAEVTNSSGD